MFKYHKTKDGEVMLICEMDNQHLMNTIRLIDRTFADFKVFSEDNVTNDYERHLYNRKIVTAEELADKTKEIADLVAPYVLEATLRGMNVTDLVQNIFMRTNAVPKQIIKRLGFNPKDYQSNIDISDWVPDDDDDEF